MAEVFGAIQRGLGDVIAWIYSAIPSYGLAIILLTIASRAVLIPLTVKQINATRKMQKLAPEVKKIQQKYKELQKKAKDRADVQQIRLKMNEEMMGLYKLHGANPAGGCLPLVAQMPVFIALFSIMRASLVAVAMTAAPLGAATTATIPANEFSAEALKTTFCRPVEGTATDASLEIRCVTGSDEAQARSYQLGGIVETDSRGNVVNEGFDTGLIAVCQPYVQDNKTLFRCRSATGTGHLPRDSKLFRDVNADRATIFGMHPGCSPSQASNAERIRQCTADVSNAGFGRAFPYYILVALIVVSQYYAGKQMMGRTTSGPAAQQQQMMTRIMPLFFGFISLNFPAGTNTYFLATNLWQMGQQTIMFRRQDAAEAAEAAAGGPKPPTAPPPGKPGMMERMRDRLEQQRAQLDQPTPSEAPQVESTDEPGGPAKPHPRSKKKKKRKR